jgi:CSLREA domain-containing protein
MPTRASSSIPTVLALVAALAAPSFAAQFVVNSQDDGTDASPGNGVCDNGTGSCTLRAAVQEANALAGSDTIQLPAGTYVLSLAGQGEDVAATGDLDITDEITIAGASSATTIVDGNAADRVFDVFNSAARVTISGLTIRNGNPGPTAYGGGMYNSSTTTLSDVIVSGNTTGVSGGGIENDNDLTITNGIVTANTAASSGGGIDNALTTKLSGVTVSGNTAKSGGGISNDFELTLLNVTVSGNTATLSGGGIRNNVTAALTSVTISGNTAPAGSALSNLSDVTLRYVLIASDTPDANCEGFGNLTSRGHNLDNGTSCGLSGSGDLAGVDPGLGPLQDNGGPTPTQALSAGSPAVDVGDADCPPPGTDQRGSMRPMDGNGDGVARCDIGAYEVDGPPPPSCPRDATLSSALCLLGDLGTRLQADVGAGPLRTRLVRILGKALSQTRAADEAATAGKKGREKKALAKAIRALGKFEGRLRRGKGPPQDVIAALTQAAEEIRGELTSVRASL